MNEHHIALDGGRDLPSLRPGCLKCQAQSSSAKKFMRDDAFSTPQALGGLRVVSLEKLRVAAMSLNITRANSGLRVSTPGGVPNKAQVKTSRSTTSRFAPL